MVVDAIIDALPIPEPLKKVGKGVTYVIDKLLNWLKR
jgi:hypothetical protein